MKYMVLRHLLFKVLPSMNNKVHLKQTKYQTATSDCTVFFYFFVYFFFEKKKSQFTENLSRRSTSIISVSSNFQSSTPNKVNDGNLNTTSIYCSHTDINQARAWLQVDLGKSYSINSVKIYYRKDGMHLISINYTLP